MYMLLVLIAALALFFWLGMKPLRHLGKLPSGERLARIETSPNYAGGQFRNQLDTPAMAEGHSFLGTMREFIFGDKAARSPRASLPGLKTDLAALDPAQDLIVWLGHSSFYMQLGGVRVLADPVFSPSASPFTFSTRAFAGTNVYAPEDMPDIDLLLISHDHWDHLDYDTLAALRGRVKKIVCGLGVGAHLEYWGFAPESILEGDWGDSFKAAPGLTVHLAPARHFSGRFLSRNRSLWTSFVLEAGGRKVFYSGDGGYGPHFAEIGRRFGPFDLVVLENGQYDPAWHYVHMLPEEVWRAASDLSAGAVLPVHAGKFSISNHAWQDPYRRISAAARGGGAALFTPIIGQIVPIGANSQMFSPWWEGLE